MVAEYLNEVLENRDENDLITAIGNVAKAIGMTKIAEKCGIPVMCRIIKHTTFLPFTKII